MKTFRIFAIIGSMMTLIACSLVPENKAIPVKAVVVSMYEIGEDTGDIPGEFQLWIEGAAAPEKVSFSQGIRDLYWLDDGVLLVNTGGGVTNAATTITALALDNRFDFSKTYWLVAGIAGGDPLDVSLGSAVWANYVVDGDLLYEIDGREIPEDWPYGMIPLGAKQPNDLSDGWTVETIVFELNTGLTEWAYQLTKDMNLADSTAMKVFREQFVNYPNARLPPSVIKGDTMGSSTYWHGELLNNWANDWVKLHAGPNANFVTSNMEDNGTMTALARLTKTGIVDVNRVLVLRTVSNYSMPPQSRTAAWSTTADYPDDGLPALIAAKDVMGKVLVELLADWSKYENETPSTVP